MNSQQMMFCLFLLGYEEALWPKTLEISHASQILTNEPQILILSYLITTVPITKVRSFFKRRQLRNPRFF